VNKVPVNAKKLATFVTLCADLINMFCFVINLYNKAWVTYLGIESTNNSVKSFGKFAVKELVELEGDCKGSARAYEADRHTDEQHTRELGQKLPICRTAFTVEHFDEQG